MSIWQKLRHGLKTLTSEGALSVFGGVEEPTGTGRFAMAVVALGAKMAKADGRVTRDEVTAFREVFAIADADLPAVERFYNLARTDVAGFDLYAKQIADQFDRGDEVLETLLDGLFHIAQSDGDVAEDELTFLRIVADIFGFDEKAFERIRLRHLPDGEASPYDILGVPHDASLEDIRDAWKALAKRYHPDRLRARGVAEEAARVAERRMVEINAAYEAIRKASAAV